MNERNIEGLARWLADAEAVVIGAGAGLSTSAGMTYSGPRFEEIFSDFIGKYHFTDMYSGGFYPFPSLSERWAYWSRYIWINRYQSPTEPVYENLLKLVCDKDYFVLTTNVDHCFQRAGFDKRRLFYTQGDFGLWQCSKPCHDKTYDNEEIVRHMVEEQGFVIDQDGTLALPEGFKAKTNISEESIPHCPLCGRPMKMNLRADDTFVQDEGWYRAADRYSEFLRQHVGVRILFLELGVGENTPGIVKYPFWQMAHNNPKAMYACINLKDAYAPKELEGRSICVEADIRAVLEAL